MANRFWRSGGTGIWDGSNTTNWSATSGGASGASVPTASDDVFFDNNSGVGSVTVSGSRTAKSVTVSGFTGTITGSGSIIISGNLDLTGSFTFSLSGSIAINAAGNITTGGKTLPSLLLSTSGTKTLLDDLTISSSLSVTGGTFDANDFNLDIGTFSSTGSTSRTINMGNGTWIIQALSSTVFNISGSNVTLNAEGSTIIFPTGGTTRSITSLSGISFNNIELTGFLSCTSLSSPSWTGTLTINDGSSMSFGNGVATVGNIVIPSVTNGVGIKFSGLSSTAWERNDGDVTLEGFGIIIDNIDVQGNGVFTSINCGIYDSVGWVINDSSGGGGGFAYANFGN